MSLQIKQLKALEKLMELNKKNEIPINVSISNYLDGLKSVHCILNAKKEKHVYINPDNTIRCFRLANKHYKNTKYEINF